MFVEAPTYSMAEENATLLQQMQNAFKKKNKNIEEITLHQLKPFYGHPIKYLVLAYGIRADEKFSGSFEDELFGIFVVDKSFTKVLCVIDFIPSQSWKDYRMELKIPDANTILVVCKGIDYGNQKMTKKYSTELIYGKSKCNSQ